jgi:hypothetical protein
VLDLNAYCWLIECLGLEERSPPIRGLSMRASVYFEWRVEGLLRLVYLWEVSPGSGGVSCVPLYCSETVQRSITISFLTKLPKNQVTAIVVISIVFNMLGE